MNAYEKVQIARDKNRPTAVSYINQLFHDTFEFHGDRKFADDEAIIGGIGYLENIPVTFIAIERGNDTVSRIKRNFGCPKPEGYRKALRLFKQAEKFSRPIICLVDTSGAFCGEDAEERGQGQAIAENLMEMMGIKTPIISIVIGEGGSGGALGLAVADRVYMLENAIYSVISPEGCASIIWKDSKKAPEAAEYLRITAEDMKNMGVAETIIHEDFKHFRIMCKSLKTQILEDLNYLSSVSKDKLLVNRYNRFRKIGVYYE
jgi:acetyl-CoA carboxylase carboxyl transferase alpha subunit